MTLPPPLLQWVERNWEKLTPDDGVLLDRLQSGECMSCAYFGRTTDGVLRRVPTHYQKELSNWICECPGCYAETLKFWKDTWEEYYSAVL